MKKLISVIALVLVMATLLTSCGVNLAKADMSDYVSLAEGAHTSIKVTIDRTNLYKETVRQAIYEALRGEAGENKTGESDTFAKYDTVQLHTILFNQKGEIVATSLGVTYKNTDTVTGFNDAESISLGFLANREQFADIENELLDTTNVKLIKDYLFTPVADDKTEINLNSFLVLTYSVTDAAGASVEQVLVSNPAILPGMLYAEGADNSNFKDGFEKNTYLEAIYEALSELCAYTKDDGTKPYVPKLNSSTAITIHVKPLSEKPADHTNGVKDASDVTIYADISFDDSNDEKDENGNVTKETYEEGTIRTALRGMVSGTNFLEIDNIQIYEPDDEKEDHDKLEGDLDVIVLPVAVTPYPNMIEYDDPQTEEQVTVLRDFIKDALTKAGLTPVGDDIAALKAQYEEYMYDKCVEDVAVEQEKAYEEMGYTVDLSNYFEAAESNAKNEIWKTVVNMVSILKLPKQNVRDYIKDQEERLEYQYYNSSYSWSVPQGSVDKSGFKFTTSTVSTFTAADTGKFKNWKEYAQEVYGVSSYADVREALRKEGEAREKEMMTAYYMADKLGITISDEKYAELIKEDADAWIKAQEDYYKSSLGYTPTFTVSDYEEYMGGEDILRAAHLLELVKDELFRITTENGGVTYNEIYPDGEKVEN